MTKSRAILRLATLAALVLYCTSLPINSPLENNDRPEVIEIIAPAAAARETLDTLNLGQPNSESSDRSKRTIDILRQLFPNLSQATADNNDSENQLTGAESQQSEVRVQFTDSGNDNKDEQDAEGKTDQEGAASDQDGFSLDDIDSPDENRDKRSGFLGGDSSGGSSSGGGSGNFLFDIIRLIAGSGGTEQNDEASNTSDDGDDSGKAADTVSNGEGIPGPVTRLFIIANRGIANLIQDLILRLAQTSERIVNFKARLITSII